MINLDKRAVGVMSPNPIEVDVTIIKYKASKKFMGYKLKDVGQIWLINKIIPDPKNIKQTKTFIVLTS
jgi:hypothetical protein